jgi:hypothetical protein
VEQFLPVLTAAQSLQTFLAAAPTFIPQTFQDQIQFVFDGTLYWLYLYINNAWQKVQMNQLPFAGFSTRVLVTGAGQNGASTFTTVQTWTTVAIDNNTEWNATSNKFVAKTAGTYIAAYSVIGEGATHAGECDVAIFVNGSLNAQNACSVPVGINGAAFVTTMAVLAVGDKIEAYIARPSGDWSCIGTGQMYIYRIA